MDSSNDRRPAGVFQRAGGFLQRNEQPIVAGVILIALAGMGFYFYLQSIIQGGLIDIDRADPIRVEFRVDLNQADWPELANLPGIGPATAKAIVQYRQRHGPFQSVDQIVEVPGIGPGKLKRMRLYLLPIEPEPRDDRSGDAPH